MEKMEDHITDNWIDFDEPTPTEEYESYRDYLESQADLAYSDGEVE